MQKIDTIIAVYNDEHSGSHVAPLPRKQWQFRGKNVTPNKLQTLLYDQYAEFGKKVGKLRKGKRLIVIKLGDQIDGLHHDTKEIITQYLDEQKEINRELTNQALSLMGFGRDDKMYWVAGTPAHAGEAEEELARDFDCVPYSEERTVWPMLKLEINGTYCMFFHHGANMGRGPNKGNGLRNRLRNIYYEYLDRGERVPRLVITADKHEKGYELLTRNGEILMHGIISPAWQVKTDFVYRIFSEALPNVGGLAIEIKADGTVLPPHFVCIDVEQDRMERI